MIIERSNNSLLLIIDEKSRVNLRSEWVSSLRNLAIEEYGNFLRDTVYPSLSPEDRNIWNRSIINNKDLHTAIQNFS